MTSTQKEKERRSALLFAQARINGIRLVRTVRAGLPQMGLQEGPQSYALQRLRHSNPNESWQQAGYLRLQCQPKQLRQRLAPAPIGLWRQAQQQGCN